MSDEDTIKTLKQTLWECRCELYSIHNDRVRADKMTMITISHIDKALGREVIPQKEAQV